MNVRKFNLGLWTVTALLCAGGLVAAGLAAFVPVEATYNAPAWTRKIATTAQASPDAQMPLDGFEAAWALSLRKPLTDSAGGATTTNTQPENPGTLTDGSGAPFVLLGTIGDSVAMVQTAVGVEIKSVGELANGAKIVAIRPWQVDVELDGKRRTIVKPREPGGG